MRESLALVVDTSLSGLRGAGELDRLIAERGKLKMIVSDSGSECEHRRLPSAYRIPGLRS